MPIRSQIHVDVPLSNIATHYRNKNYIALDVYPRVPVKQDTGKFFEFATALKSMP